jgi:hypothetical protein
MKITKEVRSSSFSPVDTEAAWTVTGGGTEAGRKTAEKNGMSFCGQQSRATQTSRNH